VYWTAYNLKVNGGDQAQVVAAIDKFMASETGKAMPTASLVSKLFSSSEQEYTHQIVFGTTDKAAFGKMYSGILNQSTDFQLLGAALSNTSHNVGSYLGKSLDASAGSNGNYTTYVSLGVSDPATYLAEFKKLAAAVKSNWGGKVGMALHQFLSGNEAGVSHIVVVDAPDFETLLDFSDKIYSSAYFNDFNMKVKGIRSTVSNSSNVIVKRYNVPQ
jgi:hypothetical protein